MYLLGLWNDRALKFGIEGVPSLRLGIRYGIRCGKPCTPLVVERWRFEIRYRGGAISPSLAEACVRGCSRGFRTAVHHSTLPQRRDPLPFGSDVFLTPCKCNFGVTCPSVNLLLRTVCNANKSSVSVGVCCLFCTDFVVQCVSSWRSDFMVSWLKKLLDVCSARCLSDFMKGRMSFFPEPPVLAISWEGQ
ncbi:unnamed protein product [Ectocarpus fasciculatus]